MRFNFVCETLDQRQTIVFMAAVIIPDLSLALFYNFDLLNGIDFLKSSKKKFLWIMQETLNTV